MRRWACILLCFSGLLPIFAAGSDPTLKIGLLTRPDEPCYQSLCRGASLAVSNWNASAAAPITLVIRGRPGQWGTDGDEAVVLALDEGVDVIIASPDGAVTHQALQVAGRTQVPALSLCTDTSVTKTGVPWAARICPSTSDEASCIFGSPKGNPVRDWVVLLPAERRGREIAHDLACSAQSSGKRIVRELSISERPTDLASILDAIVKLHPEGVLVWVEDRCAGEIVRGLRRRNFDGVLAGPSRLRNARFLQAAGVSAEGFVLPCPPGAIASDPAREQFEAAYKAAFGVQPDYHAVMVYDAVQLLARNQDRVKARDLRSMKADAGLFGSIDFDAAGNRLLPLVTQTCTGGQFR